MSEDREPGKDDLWVNSALDPLSGTYFVEITLGEDVAVSLTPDQATKYAIKVLTIAQYADYDTAVVRQMFDLMSKGHRGEREALKSAFQVVTDLRADRVMPVLDPRFTMTPIVARRPDGFEAIVTWEVDGQGYGQSDTRAVRDHAMQVMEMPSAASADQIYKQTLVGLVGVTEGMAQNVVNDLSEWRDPYRPRPVPPKAKKKGRR